jgi:hypothetical protein
MRFVDSSSWPLVVVPWAIAAIVAATFVMGGPVYAGSTSGVVLWPAAVGFVLAYAGLSLGDRFSVGRRFGLSLVAGTLTASFTLLVFNIWVYAACHTSGSACFN